MEKYDGVSVIPESLWSHPDKVIVCDACLDSIAGLCYTDTIYYFKSHIPESWGNCHTCVYELLTVFIALRLWSKFCKQKIVD